MLCAARLEINLFNHSFNERVFKMKNTLIIRFSMFFLIPLIVGIALADIPITKKVSIDGDLRYRIEIYDGHDFDNSTGMYDYSYMRTQLGLKVQVSDKVMVRVKFKESRYLGTTGSNKNSTSFFNLQEGYILENEFIGLPVDFQFGRYEFMCGRRRIQGNGAWNNFGPRTYDGFRFLYKGNEMQWDFFYAKIIERSFTAQTPYTGDSFNAYDRHLFGLSGKLLDGKIQPLMVVDWDEKKYIEDADLIITPAVHAKYTIGGTKIDFDAGYQFGTKKDNDLSSWLLVTDVTYKFDNPLKPMVGVGVDIASGTSYSDSLNGKDHCFYTPFMSRHAFKGYMDFYKDVTKGLFDAVFRVGFSPCKKSTLRLDVHNFTTMEDMQTASGKNYKQMGQEFDLRLKIKMVKGFSLDTAACAFFASDDYKPDGDPGYFFYMALTGKF